MIFSLAIVDMLYSEASRKDKHSVLDPDDIYESWIRGDMKLKVEALFHDVTSIESVLPTSQY